MTRAAPGVPLTLAILHVPDCPILAPLLARLRQVSDLPVTTREITTEDGAAAAGMSGSPTLLINGRDPFRSGGRAASAIACRIHRDEQDRPTRAPSAAQLRDALAAAAPATPGELLTLWRGKALPPDRIERAVHQAILRGFATTGYPPASAELAPLAANAGHTTAEILEALHDLDAIRLDNAGHIVVAYPFSVRPTRHRVRISDRVEVYAMCAVDALGVSAMLDQDTQVESVDTTTGRPVVVTSTGGDTSWDPPEAVVFLGATAGEGPSAECCCDHLDFFTDLAAARAWTTAHPHIPGQILTQDQAEALATRLFGSLLD